MSSINYHREGSGPPLLLLHGVGHHWQGWQPVIELLRGEFDLIACDSPGFGQSAPLPSGIEPTITSYADAFEWFLAELGLERPHVAGNSMGGAIGLELARRRAVSSVTAFSPAGFWVNAERRFCQLSLSALGNIPVPARGAVEAAARTRAGRIALFSQNFGYPARLPAEEAVATLARRLGGARPRGSPEGLRPLQLRAARGAAKHARDDRLGDQGPAAPLPNPGTPGTRDASIGHAPLAGHRPCSLL